MRGDWGDGDLSLRMIVDGLGRWELGCAARRDDGIVERLGSEFGSQAQPIGSGSTSNHNQVACFNETSMGEEVCRFGMSGGVDDECGNL